MSFVVLKFNEMKNIIYFFLINILLISALITLIKWIFSFDLVSIQAILATSTLSISLSFIVLSFLLRSVTIKHQRLSRFISKPLVHGLWKGQLVTNYQKDGKPIPPIEIYFYIKQTFLTTTIKSFTEYQASETIITALSYDKNSESSDFFYMYKFYRTKNSENKVTYGSGRLNLINEDSTLEGIYWTNADTRGEIELTLINRDCISISSYKMAKENDCI